MASWKAAPSLQQLKKECQSKWPFRSTSHDGTIGDAAHAKRKSEHNPDSRGRVMAIDLTATAAQAKEILEATIGDARVHYVIYNRAIYNRHYGWKPRPYTGSNAHTQHVHISLRNTTTEKAPEAIVAQVFSDTRPWFKDTSGKTQVSPVTNVFLLEKGFKGASVGALQRGLNRVFPAYSRLIVDGIYGDRTMSVVAEFQRRSGIMADGIVGPVTRRELAKYNINV